jgi:hypothetical protein
VNGDVADVCDAFWIALFRSRDQYHREARGWQNYLERSGALIVTTEIPDQANKSDWVRASMYRPIMRAVSIRLPVPDIVPAQDLAAKKGLPYQTYIKRLLHDALDRERPGRQAE